MNYSPRYRAILSAIVTCVVITSVASCTIDTGLSQIIHKSYVDNIPKVEEYLQKKYPLHTFTVEFKTAPDGTPYYRVVDEDDNVCTVLESDSDVEYEYMDDYIYSWESVYYSDAGIEQYGIPWYEYDDEGNSEPYLIGQYGDYSVNERFKK